jgi:simple sugar transport system permease protein
MVSGVLRSVWGVDELISSFLISAAAAPVGQVLLGGGLKDPESYLIAAPPLPAAYRLPEWWPPSRFGPVVVAAVLAVTAASVFLRYTRRGYEWKLRGANEEFARYGGIRTGMIAVGSLSVSGALYAAAGTAALMDSGQAVQGFTGGLGWDGLAVALIAGSRPELVPLAALAYTWIIHGTRAAMLHTGFPYALTGVIQAAVFLFVTMKAVQRRRMRGAWR